MLKTKQYEMSTKRNKKRVGISTQKSVGVTTTGDGLASNEEKSPVTFSTPGITKCGRSCEPTKIHGKTDKSSVGGESTRELDATAGEEGFVLPTSSTNPSCSGGPPTTIGSAAAKNSSTAVGRGGLSSGTSAMVHRSGSRGVTYAATAITSARKKAYSGAGAFSFTGRGRPQRSSQKKLQFVGGRPVLAGSTSTGMGRKNAQVLNLGSGVSPSGTAVKSFTTGRNIPTPVAKKVLQPVGSGAMTYSSASIGMGLNKATPPLMSSETDITSGSASVTYGSNTAGVLKLPPNSQKNPQPDGSTAVDNGPASIGMGLNTPPSHVLNLGAGTSASSASVTYGSSTAGRSIPTLGSKKIPQPVGGRVMKNGSASTELGWNHTNRKERRNAERIVKTIGDIPVADRDSRQTAKLQWAMNIMALCKTSGDYTSKRQRSIGSTIPDPKRPKVQGTDKSLNVNTGLPFSDVLKDKIVIAVIDRSNADGRISPDNWLKVIVKLSAGFMSLVREHPGPQPITDDAGWHQGRVKLIACADQRSCDLFTLAVSRLGEVWPGASLEAVARDNIPCRPRARAWIPIEPASKDEILQMLQYSNPSLPTKDWVVAKLEEIRGSFRSAIIVINKESLAPLVSTENMIRYGFHKIALKVYKKDEEVALEAPPQNPQDMAIDEDPVVGIETPEMEIDDNDTSSAMVLPNPPTERKAPSVDDLSDMETVDSPINVLLSEEELLRSSSEAEDADQTVLEVDLTNCSNNAAADSD